MQEGCQEATSSRISGTVEDAYGAMSPGAATAAWQRFHRSYAALTVAAPTTDLTVGVSATGLTVGVSTTGMAATVALTVVRARGSAPAEWVIVARLCHASLTEQPRGMWERNLDSLRAIF